MSLSVARGVYNPEKERFHFYVAFKPGLDPTANERGVELSFPIKVALSLTETGELSDLAFELPLPCQAKDAMRYLANTDFIAIVENRVFMSLPQLNGDSVIETTGVLEIDGAGRIIGLETAELLNSDL